MFSHFITVGIVILFPCQCLAQVTLFQRSTEVRLGVGNSMELACSVTGAIDSSRGWTGGPGFSTLITDGVSTDTSKYTESLQTIDFSLHIHNVVVDDVCGVDYRCSNGFYTSQIETIVLNSSIFSYVPTSPEIKVQSEVYDTDKKMTILVNLTKVFPEPTCTAKLGNKDVTFLSNSYNNGNCGLKSTELSINNETYDCSGSLLIKCTVGSNLFTVYDVTPSSCSEDKTCWCFSKCGSEWVCVLSILLILLAVYIILHWFCCNENCDQCHSAWCCKESCRCFCPKNGFPCCTHFCKCGKTNVECCNPRKSTIGLYACICKDSVSHRDATEIETQTRFKSDGTLIKKPPKSSQAPFNNSANNGTPSYDTRSGDQATSRNTETSNSAGTETPRSIVSASDVIPISHYPEEGGRRPLPLPDGYKRKLPIPDMEGKQNYNIIKGEH